MTARETLFASVAEALRGVAAERDCSVHVNTNQEIVTLVERGYVGGGESTVIVLLKEIHRG